MVRLVFRPYTQVRRSICTLESLRAFTRVSPGFALLRHSSPSFGSQHVCSHSNLSLEGSWSVDGANIPPKSKDFTFIPRWEVQLRALAHMLDSLVRVSRRVVKKHFVKVFPSHDGKQFHTEITPLPRKEKSLTWVTPHYFPTVPFQQFQVLFHSLFKVLCIFPSRYLFAIGLPPIFSFRWNLPPT